MEPLEAENKPCRRAARQGSVAASHRRTPAPPCNRGFEFAAKRPQGEARDKIILHAEIFPCVAAVQQATGCGDEIFDVPRNDCAIRPVRRVIRVANERFRLRSFDLPRRHRCGMSKKVEPLATHRASRCDTRLFTSEKTKKSAIDAQPAHVTPTQFTRWQSSHANCLMLKSSGSCYCTDTQLKFGIWVMKLRWLDSGLGAPLLAAIYAACSSASGGGTNAAGNHGTAAPRVGAG